MKKYSFLHPLVMSFYSRALYRDVARAWKGACILYLLFLVAILWIPRAVTMHRQLKTFIRDEAPKFIEQLPALTIDNGILSTPEPRPYFIKDPENGETIAVIDATGSITPADYPRVPIFVTKSGVMYKKSEVESRSYDFATIEHFTLTRDRIYHWLDLIGKYVPVVLYPAAVVASFAYRLIQVLILSLVALLIAAIIKSGLPYKTLFRLTVIALTPALIIGFLRGQTGIVVPLWRLWYLLIIAGYIYFAVKSASVREEDASFEAPAVP